MVLTKHIMFVLLFLLAYFKKDQIRKVTDSGGDHQKKKILV